MNFRNISADVVMSMERLALEIIESPLEEKSPFRCHSDDTALHEALHRLRPEIPQTDPEVIPFRIGKHHRRAIIHGLFPLQIFEDESACPPDLPYYGEPAGDKNAYEKQNADNDLQYV